MVGRDVLCCADLRTLLTSLDHFSVFTPHTFWGETDDGRDGGGAEGEGYTSAAFAADVQLSLALDYSSHRNDNRRKIAFAARWLADQPKRWYVDLLRQNVAVVFARERALKGPHAVRFTPRLDHQNEYALYWASYALVIPELSSVGHFLDALQVQFPAEGLATPPTSISQPSTPGLVNLETDQAQQPQSKTIDFELLNYKLRLLPASDGS